MAKVTIALCFLLAACTAQRIDFPGMISSAIEQFKEVVREELAKLDQLLKDTMIELEKIRESIKNEIQNAINEWKAKMENMTGTAEAVKTCMKEINFEEINEEVQSTVSECLDTSLDAIKKEYELTKAAFDDILNKLNQAWESVTQCRESGNIVQIAQCAKEVWDKTRGEITESWNELRQKAADLASDIAELPNQFRICGAEGKEVLNKELSAAFNKAKKCVAEKDSNSASLSQGEIDAA